MELREKRYCGLCKKNTIIGMEDEEGDKYCSKCGFNYL